MGDKIRNAREDLDLSQEDVARQIPMSQSGYSKIERGVQEPNMLQLRQICQLLHLSADYLLSLDAQTQNIYSEKDMKLLMGVKKLIEEYRM